MKTHFFPRQAIATTFMLGSLFTLVILNTEFGLIWATPWHDEKQLFLKFSKIRNSRNSQNFVWKTIFLLVKLYQQLFFFTLPLHWWYSVPSLVWFGQLLNPLKKNFFKFLKNRNSRNSLNFVWKPKFFLGTRYQFFFVLHSHYTGDTPYPVWFVLDNSSTRWKKPIFKDPFSRNSKGSVWKPNFFPRQAKQKLFVALHSHYTGDTQYHVWFDLDYSLTRCKRIIFKILKNSQFGKFAKFRMKTQLFPRHALPFFFCFTLPLHWWYSIPRLVWFGQLLNPMKKTYF